MRYAAQKVVDAGNPNVVLTERGTTFGYTDLVVDFRSIPKMRQYGFPVITDITHSLQQPNQASGVSGGLPEMIDYATIVDTLFGRGYVEKNEEKRLFPTSLGMTVDEFLKRYFDREDLSSIVDAGFTAQMEKELDEVEEAKRRWLDVVREFWGEFSKTVEEVNFYGS